MGKLTTRNGDPLIMELECRRDARRRVAETTVKGTIEVSAPVYGFLCAAAAVHGCDWEEMASRYLDQTVTEWSNTAYFLPE